MPPVLLPYCPSRPICSCPVSALQTYPHVVHTPFQTQFHSAHVPFQTYPIQFPYPAYLLNSSAVVSMGSADPQFNLAELLSQNYSLREGCAEALQCPDKPEEELDKDFIAQV